MAKTAGDAWADEAEYTRYLEGERRLFAWCLVRFGGYSPDAAEGKALERYPYEPITEPYRGLIFHELAWDWAMRLLFGDGYWFRRPELAESLQEWRLEYEREAGMRVRS